MGWMPDKTRLIEAQATRPDRLLHVNRRDNPLLGLAAFPEAERIDTAHDRAERGRGPSGP